MSKKELDAAESPRCRLLKKRLGKDAALFGAMQTGLGGASPVGGAVRVCVRCCCVVFTRWVSRGEVVNIARTVKEERVGSFSCTFFLIM